jgi:hypothetical protein
MPKLSSRLRQRRKRRKQLENAYKGMMEISNSIEMLLPILHDIGDSIIAMIMAPFITADLMYLCGRILKLGSYMALATRWSEEEIGWIGATTMAHNVSAFQVGRIFKANNTLSRIQSEYATGSLTGVRQKLVDSMVQVFSALAVQRYYFKGRIFIHLRFLPVTDPQSPEGEDTLISFASRSLSQAPG